MQFWNFHMHKIFVSELFLYGVSPRTKFKLYEQFLNQILGKKKANYSRVETNNENFSVKTGQSGLPWKGQKQVHDL